MTAALAYGGPRAPFSRPSGIVAPSADSRDRNHSRGVAMETSFQEFFKKRWAEFLKENFRTPEQIGVAFGVTSVTAQNWLDEVTSPRGHCVAQAFREFPSQAIRLIDDEAA